MQATSFLRFPLLVWALILITSCSSIKVRYLGNDHGSSTKVEMYFNKEELPAHHRVIGEMILTAPEEVKSKKVQRRLMREARRKGADAALIEQFDVAQNSWGHVGQGNHTKHSIHSKGQVHSDGIYVKVSLIKFQKP